MKLAILADVHGNLPALEATLADLRRVAPDRVVVNGDMVNRGPSGVAVLERLRGEGFVWLQGNHDDLMRKWIERDEDLPEAWFDDPFWLGTGWCAERLAEAGWIGTLAGLPLTHRLERSGAPTVLISHGSPRDYREGYGRHLSDAAIEDIVQGHDADVLVGSHTHRPLHRAWRSVAIYNTGAVGTPFNGDPRAQYLILHLDGGTWRPEFRAVAYDRDAALEAFRASGYLDAGGLSARIFYEELRHARPFLMPFLLWTEDLGRARDARAWQDFRNAFSDRFEPVRMPA